MTDHVHDWRPIPELTARYSCDCGATGYRNSKGVIVEHKTKLRVPAGPVTARTSAHGPWMLYRTKKDYDGE